MKTLALLLFAVATLAAKDIRDVRFPFVEKKELETFIAQTESELGSDVEKRAWRNGLMWLREHAESKRYDFWKWIRGMHAMDALSIGYASHTKSLADQIEALAKEASEESGKKAARLKARAAELSRSRDAISDELRAAIYRNDKPVSPGVNPTPGED